jgi:predicted  nucleic acid-binding Zn-ribbon protein
MIRIKCPKCGTPMNLREADAGAVRACPDCGQKFRVPAPSGKTAPGKAPPPGAARKPAAAPPPVVARRKPPPPDEDEDLDARDDEQDETLPPRKRRPPVEEEEDDIKRDEEPGLPRKKKKKKKKKKKDVGVGITGLHVALILVGVLLVAGLTGGIFYIQKGGASKPAENPEDVVAALKQAGATVERDKTTNDVIAVNFSGADVKGPLLGRLVAFPKLQRVDLGHTVTSDAFLTNLEDVTTIRYLNLSHTKVTGGGMEFLRNMKDLEELHLNSTIVTDHGLEHLKGCTKLKKISLDGTLADGLELKSVIPGLEIYR